MSYITVKFKKERFRIQISFERSVNDLFEYLGEVIEINRLNCRLIIGGKSYSAPSFDSKFREESPKLEFILKPGATALLISSTAEEVESTKKFRPDPLVKGFADEERDEINRVIRTQQLENANPWGSGNSEQHSEYRFARMEVLFKRLQPPPFEAEKLLNKLALDPGVLEIMKENRFIVGTLCELDPMDADIEQAEKGEGDKCLLGWNRNFGQRIALRLRTNDFLSFRKYDSIVNTLIHELTHNRVGPHNDQFWAFFNQLKELYRKIHNSRASAQSLTRASMAPSRPSESRDATAKRSACEAGRVGGAPVALDTAELRAARLRALDRDQK